MRILSKPIKRVVLPLTVVVTLMALGSALAFAVPANQTLRVQKAQTFTGLCCFSWGETVKINEPNLVVPVIVTWSSDYVANAQMFVGISLNGLPCAFYGSGQIPPYLSSYSARTVQLVIYPSDGLVHGLNSFTLCGGGQNSSSDSISLGYNTLTVQISK